MIPDYASLAPSFRFVTCLERATQLWKPRRVSTTICRESERAAGLAGGSRVLRGVFKLESSSRK